MEERRKNPELRRLLDIVDLKSKVDGLYRHHIDDKLLQRMIEAEGDIENLLANAGVEQKARSEAVMTIFEKIEKVDERIRALERRMWMANGAIAVLVFLANFLFRGGHP